MLVASLFSLLFIASSSVTCDECWEEYSTCEWDAESAAYDECSHIWEEGSQHPAFNQQCIEQQAVDQVECYQEAGCFEPGNQDCWWQLWEFGCSPYQCETYTICVKESIDTQGCEQQLDSCSQTCQQPEWEYVYEEIPECIRNNCGEIIQQCATSDACVEGIEGIANSCYNGQVNPEECMDATFIEDAEDTPSALGLCGGDETCATDLQQIGECVINSQCSEQENQEKFKKLQRAVRFRKSQKAKVSREFARRKSAKTETRPRVQRRPRPASRGRSRRKLLSSGCCECTSAKGSPFCNSECDSYICPLDGYCCNNQWDWICADAAQNVCYGEDAYGSSSYDSYDPYNYESSDYSSYDSGYDSYYSPYDSYDPYGSSSYDSYYSPSSDYYSSYDPYSSDYNSYTPGSADYYGSSGYNSYTPPKGRRVRTRGRVQRRPRPAVRRRERAARRARPAPRTRSRRKLLSSGCCECASSKGSPFCNSECDAQICPLDGYCCNNQWDWICADAAQNVCYGEDAYGSASYDSYDPYSYPSSDYSSYDPYDSYYPPSSDYYSSYDPYDSYYNPSSDYSSYDPYGYDSYGSDYGYSSYQPPRGRRVRPRLRAQKRPRRVRRVRPRSAVRGEKRTRAAPKRRERRKLTESSGCCECTESKNTPFCNSECENEICPLDPYCCNNQWDWICADASANVCNGEEAYGSTWNSYGSYTPNDYGSDNSGTCCDCQSSKGSPYCNSECDSQLCPLDPYCCNNSWDWICANSATDVCYEQDNYGDGYSSYDSYPSYDYPSYDYSSYDSYGYPSYDYSSYDPYGYSSYTPYPTPSPSYDSYGYPSYDYSSYDSYGYPSYDYSSYDSYGYPSYDYSSYDSYGYPSYDYSSYDPYGYSSYDPYGYSSYDPYGYSSYDPYGYSSDYYGSDSYSPNSYSECGEIPDIPECIATNCCSYLLECSGDSQCVSAVEGIGEECGHEDESEIAQCVEDVFINDVEQTKVYELCGGDELCVTSFTALGQCAFSNCFSTNAGYLVKSLKNSLESTRTKKANKLKRYNKIKSVKQQRAKTQLNARRQFSKNKQLKRVQQQQFNQQRRKYVNKRREFNARMKAKRAEKVKA